MVEPLDLYTEQDADPDTLRNLGPLALLAGRFQGERGVDVHPAAQGDEEDHYVETFDLAAIDPQSNGPQLLYGLRYHQHVLRPGEPETFHDQVGYLLYEPATGLVTMSLAIPRAQVALATGYADATASSFTVAARFDEAQARATQGAFLVEHFRTVEFSCTFTIEDHDTFTYEECTTLEVTGRGEVIHTDRSRLTRVAAPEPNPLVEALR